MEENLTRQRILKYGWTKKRYEHSGEAVLKDLLIMWHINGS
jgi:hypothetical protein